MAQFGQRKEYARKIDRAVLSVRLDSYTGCLVNDPLQIVDLSLIVVGVDRGDPERRIVSLGHSCQ